ncbi:hypothetical protein SKAU_G00244390 [Synaphobranchus kaupii]|uniref:Uncharacterized protein n=1 Tax=Synaphobranchus kaupii TaxID=118154 RepID=A0A9Q1IP81_SYNKA|nr:hypothetical protein SKAU_G00244390 [Synaphobranchus kaupii]
MASASSGFWMGMLDRILLWHSAGVRWVRSICMGSRSLSRGHDIGDQEEEMRPTGSDPNSRSLYRKEKAQPSVRWAPGAIVDSDQQRKTEAERLRNKKRLREKQR